MRALGMLVIAMFVGGGCAARQQTRLELRGDPRGPAVYEFREVLWREGPAGVEVVGYGVMPFYNSPTAIDYQPRWPTSGFVIFRMRGEMRAAGGYAITILGPAKRLGPGDDEVLTGVAAGAAVAAPDGRTRRIEVRDVAMRSRNQPGRTFTLSGTVVATSADGRKFEKEVARFEEELGYRGTP